MISASGSRTHHTISISTRLSAGGSISLTHRSPFAFLVSTSAQCSYCGEGEMDTNPSLTTTALDTPVTGTPQPLSLTSLITDALIGDAHIAGMQSSYVAA